MQQIFWFLRQLNFNPEEGGQDSEGNLGSKLILIPNNSYNKSTPTLFHRIPLAISQPMQKESRRNCGNSNYRHRQEVLEQCNRKPKELQRVKRPKLEIKILVLLLLLEQLQRQAQADLFKVFWKKQ